MLSSKHLSCVALAACLFAIATPRAVEVADPDHVAQLRSTGSCAGCNLADAELYGLTAEAGDLSNADLSRAVLYHAVLRGANLTGANLNEADLKGADLTGAVGADLTGAITNEVTKCPNGTAGPCS